MAVLSRSKRQIRTPIMKRVAPLSFIIAGLLALTGTLPAAAQSFPDKPVKLVVPYQPGGATDTLARAIGQQLSEMWKQPVIIDNRPGASATLGANMVAKSDPDGYTLLICDSSVYVVVPHLLAKLPYDCLLYTSDAADDLLCVDLGGRRI